MTFYADCFAD